MAKRSKVVWIGAVYFASLAERSAYYEDSSDGFNEGIRVSIDDKREDFFADLAEMLEVDDGEASVCAELESIGATYALEKREV